LAIFSQKITLVKYFDRRPPQRRQRRIRILATGKKFTDVNLPLINYFNIKFIIFNRISVIYRIYIFYKYIYQNIIFYFYSNISI
jgi:hypothetical protein